MKYVLIIHNYPDFGGASKSLFEIIKALKKNDIHIHVLTKKISNTLFKQELSVLVDKITEVKILPQFSYYNGAPSILNPNFLIGILKSFIYYNFFKDLIYKIHYDVLICNSLVLSWFPLNKSKFNILFIRETLKKNRKNFFNKFQSFMAKRFSLVVFLSLYDLKKFSIKSDCIVIKDFLMVNQEKFYPNNFTDDTLRILFVGGTDPIKGLFFFLESLSRFTIHRKISLIIAGKISLKISNPFDFILKIKHILRHLYFKNLLIKLPENITYQLAGLKNNVDNLYVESNIVIFPMIVEHQSRPIFESGFFNRTIIVPNTNNIKGIVSSEEVFFYKFNNSLSLIDVINNISASEIIQKSERNKLNSNKFHSSSNLNILIERILFYE
jgi:hypothetical protein